jgi:SsrA-binding protein
LAGTEIKSIRLGRLILLKVFCSGTELFYQHLYRRIYFGNQFNHKARSERKLLLNKELKSLARSVQAKGLTIIPLKLFTNEKEWQN